VQCMSVDRRPSARARGYSHAWDKARAAYLCKHPMCAEHARRGEEVAASVVDHITPHRGDMSLFWDSANWQALCTNCHASWKQRLEASGRVLGADLTGMPTDPGHHWHQSGAVQKNDTFTGNTRKSEKPVEGVGRGNGVTSLGLQASGPRAPRFAQKSEISPGGSQTSPGFSALKINPTGGVSTVGGAQTGDFGRFQKNNPTLRGPVRGAN